VKDVFYVYETQTDFKISGQYTYGLLRFLVGMCLAGQEGAGVGWLLLRELSGELLNIAKILRVDAYLSRHDYVEAALGCGLTLVSRLCSDAVLYYLYTREKTSRKAPFSWLTLKHNIPNSCCSTDLLTCSELTPNSRIIPERFSSFTRWAKRIVNSKIND